MSIEGDEERRNLGNWRVGERRGEGAGTKSSEVRGAKVEREVIGVRAGAEGTRGESRSTMTRTSKRAKRMLLSVTECSLGGVPTIMDGTTYARTSLSDDKCTVLATSECRQSFDGVQFYMLNNNQTRDSSNNSTCRDLASDECRNNTSGLPINTTGTNWSRVNDTQCYCWEMTTTYCRSTDSFREYMTSNSENRTRDSLGNATCRDLGENECRNGTSGYPRIITGTNYARIATDNSECWLMDQSYCRSSSGIRFVIKSNNQTRDSVSNSSCRFLELDECRNGTTGFPTHMTDIARLSQMDSDCKQMTKSYCRNSIDGVQVYMTNTTLTKDSDINQSCRPLTSQECKHNLIGDAVNTVGTSWARISEEDSTCLVMDYTYCRRSKDSVRIYLHMTNLSKDSVSNETCRSLSSGECKSSYTGSALATSQTLWARISEEDATCWQMDHNYCRAGIHSIRHDVRNTFQARDSTSNATCRLLTNEECRNYTTVSRVNVIGTDFAQTSETDGKCITMSSSWCRGASGIQELLSASDQTRDSSTNSSCKLLSSYECRNSTTGSRVIMTNTNLVRTNGSVSTCKILGATGCRKTDTGLEETVRNGVHRDSVNHSCKSNFDISECSSSYIGTIMTITDQVRTSSSDPTCRAILDTECRSTSDGTGVTLIGSIYCRDLYADDVCRSDSTVGRWTDGRCKELSPDGCKNPDSEYETIPSGGFIDPEGLCGEIPSDGFCIEGGDTLIEVPNTGCRSTVDGSCLNSIPDEGCRDPTRGDCVDTIPVSGCIDKDKVCRTAGNVPVGQCQTGRLCMGVPVGSCRSSLDSTCLGVLDISPTECINADSACQSLPVGGCKNSSDNTCALSLPVGGCRDHLGFCHHPAPVYLCEYELYVYHGSLAVNAYSLLLTAQLTGSYTACLNILTQATLQLLGGSPLCQYDNINQLLYVVPDSDHTLSVGSALCIDPGKTTPVMKSAGGLNCYTTTALPIYPTLNQISPGTNNWEQPNAQNLLISVELTGGGGATYTYNFQNDQAPGDNFYSGFSAANERSKTIPANSLVNGIHRFRISAHSGATLLVLTLYVDWVRINITEEVAMGSKFVYTFDRSFPVPIASCGDIVGAGTLANLGSSPTCESSGNSVEVNVDMTDTTLGDGVAEFCLDGNAYLDASCSTYCTAPGTTITQSGNKIEVIIFNEGEAISSCSNLLDSPSVTLVGSGASCSHSPGRYIIYIQNSSLEQWSTLSFTKGYIPDFELEEEQPGVSFATSSGSNNLHSKDVNTLRITALHVTGVETALIEYLFTYNSGPEDIFTRGTLAGGVFTLPADALMPGEYSITVGIAITPYGNYMVTLPPITIYVKAEIREVTQHGPKFLFTMNSPLPQLFSPSCSPYFDTQNIDLLGSGAKCLIQGTQLKVYAQNSSAIAQGDTLSLLPALFTNYTFTLQHNLPHFHISLTNNKHWNREIVQQVINNSLNIEKVYPEMNISYEYRILPQIQGKSFLPRYGILNIGAYYLPSGNYSVSATMVLSDSDESVEWDVSESDIIVGRPPRARISGLNESVPCGVEQNISAHNSLDMDTHNRSDHLQYQWLCFTNQQLTLFCPSWTDPQTPQLILKPNFFSVGIYYIKLEIRKWEHFKGMSVGMLNMTKSKTRVRLDYNSFKGLGSLIEDQAVTFTVAASNIEQLDQLYQVAWEVGPVVPRMYKHGMSLTIPKGGLISGGTYIFKISVQPKEANTQERELADEIITQLKLNMKIAGAVIMGQIIISPDEGNAFETDFDIEAKNWEDPDGEALEYRFKYGRIGSIGSFTFRDWSNENTMSRMKFTPGQDTYLNTIEITVEARTVLGSIGVAKQNITVLPLLIPDKESFLDNIISAAITPEEKVIAISQSLFLVTEETSFIDPDPCGGCDIDNGFCNSTTHKCQCLSQYSHSTFCDIPNQRVTEMAALSTTMATGTPYILLIYILFRINQE